MMGKIVKQLLRDAGSFVKNFFYTLKWALYLLCDGGIKSYVNKSGKCDFLTILANGPSLKDDISRIDFTSGDFVVVNDFYKSFLYKEIKPKYYVLADPLYFTKDEDIEAFIDGVDWNMYLFVPFSAFNNLNILKKMPNNYVSVVPYHTVRYEGYKILKNWIYRNGLAMPIPQNVLVPCIFNGINMGYKEIRLYGVDHSWTESIRMNEKNQVCLIDSHFYDNEQVKLQPWEKVSGEQYKMHEILRDLAQMFESYHQLREYADRLHCHIKNMTKNSYIDAFDRS